MGSVRTSSAGARTSKPEPKQVAEFTDEERSFWSFQPIRRPALPTLKDASTGTKPIDAFLLALAECLENVRRHSGVTEAHVTITEDEKIVRALVTDSGVGFDINDVDDAKLGFSESVVARLRDVGGNARLFSAPGSGTTVVLEVPRSEVTS